MSRGILVVARERQRQLDIEGYDAAHDDQHVNGELVRAALCYIKGDSSDWPWPWEDWDPPFNYEERLAKGGALLAAEIDRYSRASHGD